VIVDTSVLVALALSQAEADRLRSDLDETSPPRISAGNLLEPYMVVDGRQNARVSAFLDQLLEQVGLIVEPVTEVQVRIAREAFRRYGKASGHPARLNYGDCFACALARHMDEPLLFVGNDFAHTDIPRAL
jgi:ribonuclease VapC